MSWMGMPLQLTAMGGGGGALDCRYRVAGGGGGVGEAVPEVGEAVTGVV